MTNGTGRGWWAPPKGTHTGKLRLNAKGKTLFNKKTSKPVYNVHNEIRDAHGGQTYGTMYIREPDLFGYLDYSLFEDGVYIDMIDVEDSSRRKGLGTALVNKLKEEYPDKKLIWNWTTPLGNKLKRSLEPKVPKDVIKIDDVVLSPRKMKDGYGVYYSMLKDRKLFGHIYGFKMDNLYKDEMEESGLNIPNHLHLDNVFITKESERGKGHFRKVIRELADKYEGGVVAMTNETSNDMKKALRSFPDLIERGKVMWLPKRKTKKNES